MKSFNEIPEYYQNLNKMLQKADKHGKDDVLAVMRRLREVIESASQTDVTEEERFVHTKRTLH